MLQTGPPEPVLASQAKRGFAHVSETACADLMTHLGLEVPEGYDDSEHDHKTALTLPLLAQLLPDISDLEAAASLNRAFIEEHPNCYSDLYIDPECLLECVDKTECNKVQDFEAAVAFHKTKKELVLHTRKTFIHTFFEKTKTPKYSAAQKKPPRWLPKKDETNTKAITEWIEKNLPEGVTVICDDYNGRWRVISMNLDWKSISWTSRGYEQAASEVLAKAWEYYRDDTGFDAPYDLATLRKKYEAEALPVAPG